MSKNVVINGETYAGITDLEVLTDAGKTATFKDVDDVERVEYATPVITVSDGGLITASANGKSATHQLSAFDDADFVDSNILLGKTLFGLTGSYTAPTGGDSGGSEKSHIFETVIETDIGFTHLNIEHGLGSKKLFWAIRRDMSGDYTPKASDTILACGVTPAVWMPDVEVPVSDGTANIWDTCSPGNVAGYQRCFWSITYKDKGDGTLIPQMPSSSLVIPNYYKQEEQTENKMVVYPNWAITGNIGKFYVTIIDLSAGQALL